MFAVYNGSAKVVVPFMVLQCFKVCVMCTISYSKHASLTPEKPDLIETLDITWLAPQSNCHSV